MFKSRVFFKGDDSKTIEESVHYEMLEITRTMPGTHKSDNISTKENKIVCTLFLYRATLSFLSLI